ncbi:serine/threonine protein kinase ATG1 [Pseudohyphozyma bogoriensis]|nr:serine/threonine protein kinase ATG1 [Pseudohyphozyma bogoriensis]
MASPRPSGHRRRESSAYDRDRRDSGGRGSATRVQEDDDRIGPFVIKEEIGRGSFATVFRGARFDTKAPVAIKAVIRSKLTTKLLENLESEISILKRIKHRNIVDLKDCLKTDSHIYLIMAFCSAGDLSVYIRKRGDLPSLHASNAGLVPEPGRSPTPDQRKVLYPHPKDGGLNETIVRCFLGQLHDALRFLRAQNVIHRDIKPQNLLLSPADAADIAAGHPPGIPVLKVADFGFARWLPAASMAETLCGSPLYMAPEILRYEKYDAKADLWSVGAVLYEMAVGKPPFRAQNHVDLLRKIEKGDDKIRFPDEKKTEEGASVTPVANDIKAIIRRLLKRNPAERMNFEDFFVEANIVATGGPAAHLATAEAISAARNRAERPSPTRSPIVRHTHSPSPSEDNRAAFVTAAAVSAYAQPVLHAAPSPTLPPPIPAYVDQELPAFARRPTPSPAPSSSSGVPGRRASTPRVGEHQDVKVKDYAAGVVRRPSLGGQISDPPSLSSTPPSALDRFAQSNKGADSMTESNDSILGRDYVVVEKRTVEINALADELASVPKRESAVARRPSRGFLSRPPSARMPTLQHPPSPFPPANPLALTPTPCRSPLALVGSPTAAIAKVLNMASLKLFGSPTDGILLRRSSARKPIMRSAPAVDPEEEKVLAELEEIAQKALVIFDFADSRIMQILPPTPQSSSSTSLGTPSYFSHMAAREQSASNPFSPVPTAMRRTSSSSSERPFVLASSARADVLAAEAMVLYLKALAFLGKGIEKARKFWGNRPTNHTPNPDFNDAVQWFRTRFNECFDKAEFSKTRCQDDIPESATYAEKLIYDRALEISRAAAVNELRGESPTDCETAYETALWMLYAILDETMAAQVGDMVEEEDRTTVNKFVTSITTRLAALRRKNNAA